MATSRRCRAFAIERINKRLLFAFKASPRLLRQLLARLILKQATDDRLRTYPVDIGHNRAQADARVGETLVQLVLLGREQVDELCR